MKYFLFWLIPAVLIVGIAAAWIYMFRLSPKFGVILASPSPSLLPSAVSPSATIAPTQNETGTVVGVTVAPDGQKVELVTDQKTYLLPINQKVKLYTSETKTSSVFVYELKGGTYLHIIKITNPERYTIYGTVDRALTPFFR